MSGRAARILGSAVVASVALVVPPAGTTAASASAESVVVVRGTDFPDPQTVGLALTGCETFNAAAGADLTVVPGVRPRMAGSGNRSLGFRRTGDVPDGTAVGTMFAARSLLGTTEASVRVDAPAGTTGVAYAVYQEAADAGSQRFWVGRHRLAVGPGWQTVDARTLAYHWTMVDLATGAVTPRRSGTGTVGAFAGRAGAATGGLYTIGFGCDGKPFAIDTVRYAAAGGTTTYDLEGPNDPKSDPEAEPEGGADEGEGGPGNGAQQGASGEDRTPATPTQDEGPTKQPEPAREPESTTKSKPAPTRAPEPKDEPEPRADAQAPPAEETEPPAETAEPSDGNAAGTTTSEAPAGS